MIPIPKTFISVIVLEKMAETLTPIILISVTNSKAESAIGIWKKASMRKTMEKYLAKAMQSAAIAPEVITVSMHHP